MAFTYTWEVTGLKTKDEVNKHGETLTDAVVQTYWKVVGVDEAGNEGSFSGATPFTAKDVPAGEFLEFSQLTEEAVLGWIKNVVVNDAQYKKHIDWRIQNEIDQRKIKDVAMPWAPEKSVTPSVPVVATIPEVPQPGPNETQSESV